MLAEALPFIVSDVDIIPVKPRNGLVAFASCVINGHLYLSNIAIHTRPNGFGFRLVFPVKVLPNSKEIHCFHPITRKASALIHDAIISKFEALIRNRICGEKVETKSKQSGESNDNNTGISQHYTP